MDEVDVSYGVESFDVGREDVFRCLRKSHLRSCNSRRELETQAVIILRMKGNQLLQLACLLKSDFSVLHILYGLVEVINNHHHHLLFGSLLLAPLDKTRGAEGQQYGDCCSQQR